MAFVSLPKVLQAKKYDNFKVHLLIEKFKNGRKMTEEELSFLRKKSFGIVDQIERISHEREMVEQRMRLATSKMDVQNVVMFALQKIAKHLNYEDRIIRAMQIGEAQYEYMQTNDYKEKPNSHFENSVKLANSRFINKSAMQHTLMAIVAYEQVKFVTQRI